MSDQKRESVSLAEQSPVVSNTQWSICCSKSDSSAVKYMVQCGFASTVMIFSMYCIITAQENEDKAIYWSLLSSTLTYFLDAPTLDVKSQ